MKIISSSISKNFSRLTEANLDYKLQSIVHALTGNPNFPDTDPKLEAFIAVKNAYFKARENAANGGKTEIALKNQAKLAILEQLTLLATNIESLAKGDRAKLISSGFDLAKTRETQPPLTGPLTARLSEGLNPGEIKVSINNIPGAVSFNYEYTLNDPQSDDAKWIVKSSTAKNYTLTGLPNATRVYVRVIAIGRKNQELYSEISSKVTQ